VRSNFLLFTNFPAGGILITAKESRTNSICYLMDVEKEKQAEKQVRGGWRRVSRADEGAGLCQACPHPGGLSQASTQWAFDK
jgi:hypothetical protein